MRGKCVLAARESVLRSHAEVDISRQMPTDQTIPEIEIQLATRLRLGWVGYMATNTTMHMTRKEERLILLLPLRGEPKRSDRLSDDVAGLL